MSTDVDTVIIYRYDQSPFSVKIDNVLLLKNIPHRKVNVKSLLPRPEITDFLGLGYRRIPVLAIGNDIYCDTSLIASTLERRFPASQEYGTIFPQRQDGTSDIGAIKTYAKHYADDVIFPLAPVFLPWDKFPDAFLKDREAYRGAKISPTAMANARERNISLMTSHLVLAEEQLKDGRLWLFNTSGPSLADISLHFPLSWALAFPEAKGLVNEKKLPLVGKWIARLSQLLKNARKKFKVGEINAEDAARTIALGSREVEHVVGFDTTESTRLGVRKGDIVQVAPDDTGRTFPTIGKLVGLSTEEFVVETTSKYGNFRVHFPRIGFSVRHLEEQRPKL